MQIDWLPSPQLAELRGEEWAGLFLRHPGQEGASAGGCLDAWHLTGSSRRMAASLPSE